MAVLPISGVNAVKQAVNFQGRKRKTDENISEGRYEQPNQAGKMVTIPVAVLMALATTSLNAKTPVSQQYDRNIDQTELLAYAAPAAQSAPSQAAKSDDYYFYFNKLKKAGLVINTMEVPGREPYTMMLLRDEPLSKGETDCCSKIVMLPHKYSSKDENGKYIEVPEISKLIYHDIGANEFCGVYVERTRRVGNTYKVEGFEIKLPDEAANIIINLLANESEFVNLTDIKFAKTTSSSLQH